ncbi:hypothetical protein COO60DRAFT_1635750 [Scenedesmus sp. NREL 46B-D3]|nr:hypothetical protein COO60DRAFT_1635750 [Scenedesmus sp. NREL 46B-D3]
MDLEWERVVRRIHGSATKAAVYVTGGASQGVSWLLCVPGASSTVLEVVVPYSRGSLVQLLGQEPTQYCSADTALSLAKAAYQRAAALTAFGTPVGARSRWQEEQLVGQALLQGRQQTPLTQLQQQQQQQQQAAAGAAAPVQLDVNGLDSIHQQDVHDEVCSAVTPAPDPLQELLAGRVRCVEFSEGARVYLPGSFNPLHEGHTAMLAAAVQMAGTGAEGCFELTVQNADKGQLSLEDVQARVAQFVAAGLPLLVTSATLLVDKARLLPGSTFVLGWDTAVRIVMPKYYGNSEVGMQLVFRDIQHADCSFLVAGRVDDKGDGSFKGLADIKLPSEVADLFAGIPEERFRSDVSSTALRAAGKGL